MSASRAIAINVSAVESRIRQTVGQLIEGADKLSCLASILEELGALPVSASPPEIRQTATGVHAAAMQALVAAATAVGLSERLSIIAQFQEAAEASEMPL